MDPKGGTVERRIARIASANHGVITRSELLKAGVTSTEIKRRVRRGSLIAIHRGVFRVGHLAPSIEAACLAAVKACGERALLAGFAAAHLLGLWRRRPARIEVIAPTYRRVPGVVTRRDRIGPRESGRWRGVPVTSPQRTVIDLAAALKEDQLARAVHEADVLHHTTPEQIEQVLSRRHNWPGARKLRRVLWGKHP